MSAGLQLDGTTIRFGGIKAVTDLTFSVQPGELLGLIGPNGAGKTTIFNLITGVYAPTGGAIRFNGLSLRGRKPHQIAQLGISRTFQNIRLFSSLRVFDNVRAAMIPHLRHGIVHALVRGRGFADEETAVDAGVMELLEIFELGSFRDEQATCLPYGAQRRLEIVRALATRPKLLLLDEPAAGMNPCEKEDLMRLIRFVRDKFQIAIMLVEHDMKVVMGICQRVIVIDYGIKIAEGTPAAVQCDPKVLEAYLGAGHQTVPERGNSAGPH